MTSQEMHVRSLLVQYEVFRKELLVFTVIFVFAMLMIGAGWVTNHIMHEAKFGMINAVFGLVLGIAMASHCGNTIKSIQRISNQLNRLMEPVDQTFDYDLGKENDPTRMVLTVVAKIIAGIFLLWCFTPWPQW